MGFSEPNMTKTVYLVIWSLQNQGVFSPKPENVMIERTGGPDIYPCRRSYGSEGLDLSQLEWASKEGRFWFNGPVIAIKIIKDKGPIQGDLRLEVDRMSFSTSINASDYRNFEAAITRLKDAAQSYGLRLSYKRPNPFILILVVSYDKSLSVTNATEFNDKIRLLHQSVDNE